MLGLQIQYRALQKQNWKVHTLTDTHTLVSIFFFFVQTHIIQRLWYHLPEYANLSLNMEIMK